MNELIKRHLESMKGLSNYPELSKAYVYTFLPEEQRTYENYEKIMGMIF